MTTITAGKSTTTIIGEPVKQDPITNTIINIGNPILVEKTTEEIVDIHLTQGTAFEYSSAEGLLYKTDTGEPLSLLTSKAGQRVLDSMFVKKKFIPSILEDGAAKITGKESNTTVTKTENPKIIVIDGNETPAMDNIETTVINDKETTEKYSLWITVKNIGADGSPISLVDDQENSKVIIYRQDECLIPMGQVLTDSTQGGTDNE